MGMVLFVCWMPIIAICLFILTMYNICIIPSGCWWPRLPDPSNQGRNGQEEDCYCSEGIILWAWTPKAGCIVYTSVIFKQSVQISTSTSSVHLNYFQTFKVNLNTSKNIVQFNALFNASNEFWECWEMAWTLDRVEACRSLQILCPHDFDRHQW